jgi:hypothetical protein
MTTIQDAENRVQGPNTGFVLRETDPIYLDRDTKSTGPVEAAEAMNRSAMLDNQTPVDMTSNSKTPNQASATHGKEEFPGVSEKFSTIVISNDGATANRKQEPSSRGAARPSQNFSAEDAS